MAHWQLFLTILLFWSLFGKYEPYKPDNPDTLPSKSAIRRLWGTHRLFVIQFVLAWFVSGWLLPFVNT